MKKTLLILPKEILDDEDIKGLNDPDFNIVSGDNIDSIDNADYDEIILNDKSVSLETIHTSLLKPNGVFIDINKDQR